LTRRKTGANIFKLCVHLNWSALRIYIRWLWRHSVCNSYRRHVGGIQRCNDARS